MGPSTLFNESYQANEALVAHRFVKLAGDQKVDQADTQGENVLGVGLYDASAAQATAGEDVSVATLGIVYVEAAGAITRGAQVTTSANGRCETAASGDFPAGRARKAAGAAGDLIPVFLTPDLPALA